MMKLISRNIDNDTFTAIAKKLEGLVPQDELDDLIEAEEMNQNEEFDAWVYILDLHPEIYTIGDTLVVWCDNKEEAWILLAAHTGDIAEADKHIKL